MANFSNYRFPVPEARRLASLESVRQDLDGVLEFCVRLEAMRQGEFDALLWEALSAAAVVRYARCFSPGARDELGHSLLDKAPPHVRESHEYFIAVRSKHVAHSVNEFEENDVTVTLREDGLSLEIQGIGARHGRVVGLAFQDPSRLREACAWVLTEVRAEIATEQQSLLVLARQYGADKIKAFGTPEAVNGATDRMAKRGRGKP